jgi:N-acetylglutamate synthase-like GNAT family acetyltransferase
MPKITENKVVIDYLARHEALIPEITDLLYGQWADLFRASGTSKEKLKELLVERAVTDKLPIALVALSDGVLAGTGSIKLFEPGTRAGLSPWLAGMYVKDAYRGSGIGASIVRALEAKASELGVKTMYLSVGAAEEFYVRLGWTVLERVNSYGVKAVAVMAKNLLPETTTLPRA